MEFPLTPVWNRRGQRLFLRGFLSVLLIFTVVSCGGGGESSPAGLSAPAGVTATAGDGSASVGWTAVAGATSYNIYYSTTTGVPKETATKIAGVTTAPKIVTGLNNGTTYFFVVTAIDNSGEGADSNQVSATPALAPPAAPTGVTATAGHGEAVIGWDNVAGAASYNVYYSTTPGVNSVTSPRFTGVSSSPYIATGLINGTTYYFVVTAVNAAGEGTESSQVSATPTPPPPPAPTGVAATPGDGSASINWSAVAGATSYNLYYSPTAGVTKATGTEITNVISPRIVNPLTNGTTWYFVVTAVNADGESVESGEVSTVPIPNPPPDAPTGVAATAGASVGGGGVMINWSAVTGATSYNIYYATTDNVTKATGTKVTGVTSSSVISGLIPGTQYHFVVTAVNAGGESVESSQAAATPFVEYVAYGDSITFGDGDNFAPDDTSLDGRNAGGGFEPILNNLLTSATGIPHSVVNEGWGGYKASDALDTNLPGDVFEVLAKHPNAAYYLVLFGTNEADPDSGVSSSSYRNSMQQIINAINSAGKIPYLAKVPYSLDGTRIPKIEEFNLVIDDLVAVNGITVPPPDFFGWFQANQSQMADDLHPNGAGYQSMADLWRNALVP